MAQMYVAGDAKLTMNLRTVKDWDISQSTTYVSRSISQIFQLPFFPALDVCVWTGQMVVPAAGSKQWFLNNSVPANQEVNGLGLGAECTKAWLVYVRNLSTTKPIVLESDSGGIGNPWTGFMADGSELLLPAGAAIMAFCPADQNPWGWVVGADMALNFRNDDGSVDVEVECGIVGGQTP